MRRTLIFSIDKISQMGHTYMFYIHNLLLSRKIIRFAKRSAHTRAYIYKV